MRILCWPLCGLIVRTLWTIIVTIPAVSRFAILATALTINIGALLDSEEHRQFFIKSVQEVNAHHALLPPGVSLNASAVIIQSNPLRTSTELCERLLSSPVHALLINHPSTGFHMSSAAASYTAAFYRIPVISLGSRESQFSDKNVHRSFLRTVPPYPYQADIWVKILMHFGWKNIVLITSANQNGRMLLGRLKRLSEAEDVTIEQSIEIDPEVEEISVSLKAVHDVQSRVFLLYVEMPEVQSVLDNARLLGLTEVGHVWIVTEQVLSIRSCPTGAIGVKLKHQEDKKEHILDTIKILTQAIAVAYSEKPLEEPPKGCGDTASVWSDGLLFFETILKQVISNGQTGSVSFDEEGNRLTVEYDIINIQQDHRQVVVGNWQNERALENTAKLTLDKRKIIWPGESRILPKGFIVATHLKIYTLREAPYTYVELESSQVACTRVFLGILCYDGTQMNGTFVCCWGYNIDLLRKLSTSINFTFDLFLSSYTPHVSLERDNRTTKTIWKGILGELIQGDGDMAIAPLTIMPEHAKYVDFSKPFKYLGITLLEKKQRKTSTLNSFFQPFTDELWILVMVCLHVVAVCMYLLDRFSPFSRYILPELNEPEEDALNLSSAMWFSWGVLLNSGIGEGTPRSFGGRVLGIVWAGFAMIMVASYTANLAAFLVLDRPQTSLTGLNDVRLRNPLENFTFATVRGSAVDLYFRRQVELANMYRNMEKRNYETADLAVQAVKTDNLSAFIWDSARLDYEVAKDPECELATAGELFGRSGYGVALRKGSPWTTKVTLAILGYHESGFMEDLDNKYIHMRNVTKCVPEEDSPATLGLKNMAGVFILVAMGISGGIILLFFEITFKRHQVRKQRTLRLSRMAFDRWRRTVERRKKSRQRLMLGLSRANTIDVTDVLDERIKDEDASFRNKQKLIRGVTLSLDV